MCSERNERKQTGYKVNLKPALRAFLWSNEKDLFLSQGFIPVLIDIFAYLLKPAFLLSNIKSCSELWFGQKASGTELIKILGNVE